MDTDTAWTPTARDTDMSTPDMDTVMVTLAEAAELAQVSVRTIRRWIQHGHLPVTEGDQGKMVSPADLPLARERAGAGHRRGHDQPGHGRGHGHDQAARDTATAMTASQVQAVAFRDTFIQPLVDQLARQEEKLTAQAERIGRLSAERDALQAEVDRRRDQEASTAPPVAAQAGPGAARGEQMGADPLSSTPAAPGGWRARLAAWWRG